MIDSLEEFKIKFINGAQGKRGTSAAEDLRVPYWVFGVFGFRLGVGGRLRSMRQPRSG